MSDYFSWKATVIVLHGKDKNGYDHDQSKDRIKSLEANVPGFPLSEWYKDTIGK
jgi:hypothetical protein